MAINLGKLYIQVLIAIALGLPLGVARPDLAVDGRARSPTGRLVLIIASRKRRRLQALDKREPQNLAYA
jgi:hypothetical protein